MTSTFFRKSYLYVFLLVIAFIHIFLLGYNTRIISGLDTGFLLSRIHGINDALLNHNSLNNLYSFSDFSNVGSAIQNFYPNKFLLFFSIPYLITHNFILSYYTGLVVLTFIGLIIGYHTMLSFCGNKQQALFFSVFYIFSNYHIFNIIYRYDLGEWISMLFLPLCLLGFYQILYQNKIKGIFLLAVGEGLILSTHILSFIINVVVLAFIWLVYTLWNRQNFVNKTIKFILAALLMILINLTFLVNYWQLHDFIQEPQKYSLTAVTVYYAELLTNSLNNTVLLSNSLGILFIFIIGYIALNFKKVPTLYRNIFLIGIILSVSVTNFIPWNLFNNTAIQIIQFPTRFIGITSLFVAIFAAFAVSQIIAQYQGKLAKQISITILCAFIGIQFLTEFTAINKLTMNAQNPPVSSNLSTRELINSKQPTLPRFLKLHNSDIPRFINGTGMDANMTDYWPMHSTKDRISIITQKINSTHGGASFSKYPVQRHNIVTATILNSKDSHTLDLPILNYQNQYYLYINGTQTSYTASKRGTIMFKTNAKKINLKLVPKATTRYNILTSISLIIGIISIIAYFKLKKY